MERNNIHIAAIQETKLTSKAKTKATPNYTLERKDRGNDIKGGGLAFLIHESIPYQKVSTPPSLTGDKHLEELTIQVDNNSEPLHIRNIYIPPASSCDAGYVAPINNLRDGLARDSIILGDLNAHHEMWYSEDDKDARGELVAEWISDTDLGIINEDSPTRVTAAASTAPDLSIASARLITTCTWSAECSLSSDHLPILITLSSAIRKVKSQNRTYINFKKADWAGFEQYSEELFASAPISNNVHNSEKFFRSVLTKASKRFIPKGRIPKIINGAPTEAVRLMKERDELRKAQPADPRISEINTRINNTIKQHRQDKWLDTLKECDPGSKKLWDTIKSLNNPGKTPPNLSVKFNNTHYSKPSKIANMLNSQYTPPSSTKPTKAFRKLMRDIKKKSTDSEVIITIEQTKRAIKKAKCSKAVGPDGLSPIMLKYLGPAGLAYLTRLYNNVLNQSIIPPLWKVGRIIPLLKPGKPADEGKSYRPISLLSPAAKILESIILPEIQASITLAPHQHGFRKGRSTLTALQEMNDHITTGLNQKKPVDRTVMVAIDLSRAFDTVNHEILLKDVSELPLKQHLKRFLFAYLRGRQTYVEFRGAKSKHKKMKQGVPQGGVLSPTLFNLYMSKLPSPPGSIRIVTYADDSSVLNSGKHIDPICTQLNGYLDTLNNWFKERNLLISAPKSSATLFTTFSNEMSKELPIMVDNTTVPTVKNPTILGVTFDPTMTFKTHAAKIRDKINKRTNILKALAGTSWGKDKETLLTTHKAISGSVLNYCAPVWTPTLSATAWTSLQASQNAAVRVATGCVKMTAVDHLQAEAKMMGVQDHCEMLSQQFLLATTLPDHPNHSNIDAAPPRLMKSTLRTRFADSVRPLTADGVTDSVSYKQGLKTIHTNCVATTIRKQTNNKVLNAPAPRINKTETSLPRKTRTTLAQLRSGYATTLNSYLHRINPTTYPTDACPNCSSAPHTTAHLFQCSANPTDLEPRILWEDPPAAAVFLDLPTNQDLDLDDND